MEIEAGDRYGNKRSYHKPNGSGFGSTTNKVCFHWRAGRCSRHPCPYLHSELPQTLDSTSSSSSSSSNPKRPFRHQNPNPSADTRPHGLVWRNPNAGSGGGGGGASKWGGKVNGGGARQVQQQQQQNRLCKFFLSGTCSFGESCKFLHSWFQGDSFSLLTPLQGHQQVITGIALPSGSDKLYSGSKDETVRVWDCQTGQCVGVVNMGGEVGCMINEGPWIFVGITNAVKAWNTQTATDLKLDGPAGQVYALVVGNGMLFAGIQDGCILAWKFNAAENCFQPAASLTGHRLAVVSLVVGGTRLYSGSMDHTIRVWDLATLQCIQTLTDHTSVVMSLLCWDQFLLSCSLDKTIKIWVTTESGNLEVTYTHDEEHGVLALCGMPDAQAKPVLFSACNDNSVRLYDLPSFSGRGKIFSKEEVRAIQIGPGGLFFTGDGTGELKVWKWVGNGTPST